MLTIVLLLKPSSQSNILIDESKRACLVDFGLSHVAYHTQANAITTTATNSEFGSLRWMAPELLHSTHDSSTPKASTASDIYAFGMVMLEACSSPSLDLIRYLLWSTQIFTGKIPYHELKRDALILMEVLSFHLPQRPIRTLLPGLNDNIWSLIQECWCHDPERRPSIQIIVSCLEQPNSGNSINNDLLGQTRRNPDRPESRPSGGQDSLSDSRLF